MQLTYHRAGPEDLELLVYDDFEDEDDEDDDLDFAGCCGNGCGLNDDDFFEIECPSCGEILEFDCNDIIDADEEEEASESTSETEPEA